MKRSLIVTIIVASLIALLSYLYWDKALAYYFATHHSPLHKIFSFITKLGLSEYYLIPSFFLFILAKGRNEQLSKGALFLFLSVALSGIFIIIIKIIVARFRPPALIHDNLFGFNWFELGYMVNSFPSGHATTAFSAFVALGLMMPRFYKLFLFIAALIALSRVILGVHYLSDIIMGGVIGTLWAYYLYNRIFKGMK